ncbi:MAG TPA: DUF819 domain-containing protein [Clostridiaceae bacterium]|nr:DUF819 domain-containing protein [Clostridiaceae bacterium]
MFTVIANSLISADNTWALWAILVLITCISIYLEQKYNWAAKITGAIIGLLIAMLLANFNVIPTDAPVYDTIWGYVVPLGIPLLLFNANLKKIWRESGRILAMFLLSALGTFLGVFVSFFLLKGVIAQLAPASALMTGTYIGGGVNFAAMAAQFEVATKVTAWKVAELTVADNLLMALYFFVLLAIPSISFFRKHYNHPHVDEVESSTEDEGSTLAAQYWNPKNISLLDIAKGMATSFMIVWISTELANWFADLIPVPQVSANVGEFFQSLAGNFLGSQYLWITTITMLLATFLPNFVGNINGAQELGTFLIYIFLVVIGVPASIPQIIKNAPLLLVFAGIIVLVNMLVSLGLGKLFKFDLEEILLCSNANIGGPTTAAAMAISKGWTKLVGPIILAGIFGYVIGNYLGVLMGTLLSNFQPW